MSSGNGAAALGEYSLAELSAAIQNGGITPVEATEGYLDRIGKHDERLNSYITVMADAAREAAAQSAARHAAGSARGPLDGVPLAVKDLVDVAGAPTTNGMEVLRDNMASTDAEAIRRLKEAGAVILGKLNMHEMAYGPTNDNPHYGKCHNPWKHGHTPGGSSGGSGSAVAAGLCAGALGTDNGGSIRLPASFCGIAGLKPTWGLVSVRGMQQLSWSTVHLGPMTRGVDGIALMMAVLGVRDPECADSTAPREPLDFTLPAEPDIEGLRVGILEGLSAVPPEEDVAQAFGEALSVLEKLGAKLQPVTFEDLLMARNHAFAIMNGEAAAQAGHLLDDPSAVLGDEVRSGLAHGRAMTAERMARALRYRLEMTHQVNRAFEALDVMVCPTTPVAPFSFDTPFPKSLITHTPLADLTQMPSLTIPMGFSGEGLPLGLMVMAPAFQDALTLRVGKAYESATDWHTRRPAL